MIDINEIYLLDLKDDFEEIGRGQRNFTVWEFINSDLNRAFGLGCIYNTLVETEMWIPVSIRKFMRHLPETLSIYEPQLEWINSKYKETGNIMHYYSFVLDNMFFDSIEDKFKVAVGLGNIFTSKK